MIDGPTTRVVEAPLDILPLYVRANALIPTIEPPDFLTDAPFDLVIFDGYLLDAGSFDVRDTDGTTSISASIEGTQLHIQASSAKRILETRLIPLSGTPAADAVQVNGATLAPQSDLEIGLQTPAGWRSDDDGAVRVVIRP